MLFDVVVAATLLSCVFLALIIWGIAFVGSQRWLLVGEIVLQQGRPNNRPAWGFHYHFENHSSGAGDNVRAQAQRYLLRVVALTRARQVDDGDYLLPTGRMRLLVGDKFIRVSSNQGESTCFSVSADWDMPRAELVASALLQLKNNPGLFKQWREMQGYTFKP